jgi:hypothetical protein
MVALDQHFVVLGWVRSENAGADAGMVALDQHFVVLGWVRSENTQEIIVDRRGLERFRGRLES